MLRSVTEVFFSGVAVASCKVEQEAGYSFSAHRLTINLCWRVQKDHGHGHESWYVWYLYQYDMVCLYGMLIYCRRYLPVQFPVARLEVLY